MKLSFLLFALWVKLGLAARRNALFIKKLKAGNFSLVIQTADKMTGRLFVFSEGHIFSRTGAMMEQT